MCWICFLEIHIQQICGESIATAFSNTLLKVWTQLKLSALNLFWRFDFGVNRDTFPFKRHLVRTFIFVDLWWRPLHTAQTVRVLKFKIALFQSMHSCVANKTIFARTQLWTDEHWGNASIEDAPRRYSLIGVLPNQSQDGEHFTSNISFFSRTFLPSVWFVCLKLPYARHHNQGQPLDIDAYLTLGAFAAVDADTEERVQENNFN